MPYSPILLVHIAAGTVGLLSGTAAIIFRKGSARHAWAGRVFVVAMLTMASLAVYIAVRRHEPSNIGGGILTFYLIGTAWLTARRRDGETSRLDWVVLLIPLTLGILTWMNGISIVRSGVGSPDGVPVGMTFFMGSVMLLAAAGDVRMLVGRGVVGAKRIARHLWRMCFALFIAAGSIFLARQQIFPAFMRKTGALFVLSFLPLILMIFWMVRVRFTNAFKRKVSGPLHA